MSFKNLAKRKEGFTIIEVLIVLAIAGLIMLIIFLAVPALQRNQRNTRRTNDAATASGVLQEAISNNNGIAPVGTVSGNISTTSALATIPTVLQNASYGVMDWMDYLIVASGANTLPASVDNHSLIIRNNLKCNSGTATPYVVISAASPQAISVGNAATNIATSTGASVRSYVVVFAVESTGTNITARCIEV